MKTFKELIGEGKGFTAAVSKADKAHQKAITKAKAWMKSTGGSAADAVKKFDLFPTDVKKLQEAAMGVKEAPKKDDEEEVTGMKPRSKGEEDFVAQHKTTTKPHPVAADHQHKGGTKTYKQFKESFTPFLEGGELAESNALDHALKVIEKNFSKERVEAGKRLMNLLQDLEVATAKGRDTSSLKNELKKIRDAEQKLLAKDKDYKSGVELRVRMINNVLKESVIQLEDLNESFSVGSLKLNSGETVKVDEKTSKALSNALSNLSSTNRKRMEAEAMKDKKSFDNIVKFAMSAE